MCYIMTSNAQDLYKRCLEFNNSRKHSYPGFEKYIENDCRWFAGRLSEIYEKHKSTIKKIGEDHIRTLEEIVFPLSVPIKNFIETWEKLEKIGGEEAPKYLILPYIRSLENSYKLYKSNASNYEIIQSYHSLSMERRALDILLSNRQLILEAIEIQKSKGPLPLSEVISILYRERKIPEELMRKYESYVLKKYTDFTKKGINLNYFLDRLKGLIY